MFTENSDSANGYDGLKRMLSRQEICTRLAMEFQTGWVVNLGVGMPTLCSNYVFGEHQFTLQAENGIVGYGPLAMQGEEDPHLVNAGGQAVILLPGASIMNHADAFALIRGGYIDVTVLGAYQASADGSFANWKIPGRTGGSIGGAMDLAISAKRVWLVMEHTTKDGQPRLIDTCTMPITAQGVVSLISTNLGLIEVTKKGFLLREIAKGYTPSEVQSLTGSQLHIAENLKETSTIDLQM